jgi:N-dimethylarginine dimethylaminohydrolase
MKIDRVLMCPPTYFDIEYSINPWMDTSNRVDKPRAHAQWDYVRDLLQQEGVAIETIEPAPGLPDMTFTGDCGMVHGRRFLASNFRHAERQGEVALYTDWLRRDGFEICTVPREIPFEGLGDVVYYGSEIVFGHGPRSAPEALACVRACYPDLRVVCEVKLCDPAFFHTGLALALLDSETVLYYPAAFTRESNASIRSCFPRAIAVSEQDARRHLVCNNIPLGHKLFVDGCTQELEKELAECGFEVVRCDMSEFKKSGGSVRCLILKL